MKTHDYTAGIVWDGNTGTGTSSYTSYGRQYRLIIDGKPDLPLSSDPLFRGEAEKHNPEDLFLASISACHMLFVLSLCARNGIRVTAYEDRAQGRMTIDEKGGGKFEEVTLYPRMTIAAGDDAARAAALHDTAHELCFIANSCSVPIHHQVTVSTE